MKIYSVIMKRKEKKGVKMEENLYSIEQVAEILSLTTRTIQNYINEKKLKAYKVGAKWRIYESDLEEFIKKDGSSFDK